MEEGVGWNGQVNMKYSLITSLTTQHSHSPTRDNHLNKVWIELRDSSIWFGLAVSFPLNFNKTLMLENARSDRNHLRSTKIDPAKKANITCQWKCLGTKVREGGKQEGRLRGGLESVKSRQWLWHVSSYPLAGCLESLTPPFTLGFRLKAAQLRSRRSTCTGRELLHLLGSKAHRLRDGKKALLKEFGCPQSQSQRIWYTSGPQTLIH